MHRFAGIGGTKPENEGSAAFSAWNTIQKRHRLKGRVELAFVGWDEAACRWTGGGIHWVGWREGVGHGGE